MKKHILLSFLALTFNYSIAQEVVNPVIKSNGGIYSLPNLDKVPDQSVDYKIVIDLRSGPSSPAEINPALNNIARMLNLHAEGGIDAREIKVIGVMHALATPATQNNEMYNEKYGVDNPNLTLIKELKEAGVDLYVCGQSLVARDFGLNHLNEDIELSISALTILTEYTQKGYTLLVF